MGDRSSLVVAFIWIIIATLLSIYDTFVRRLCDTVPVQYVYGLFNKAEQRMKEEMEKKFGKAEEKDHDTDGYFGVLKEFQLKNLIHEEKLFKEYGFKVHGNHFKEVKNALIKINDNKEKKAKGDE